MRAIRNGLWRILRWFLFRLDAETAHLLTLRLISGLGRLGPAPLCWISGETRWAPSAPPVVLGLPFRSRVGLAAGFDKNAEVLSALPWLGFGFAEIGTVTPRPQPGNPRPRLFRDPPRQVIFNRMGFNSLGAAAVSADVGRARAGLPDHFRVGLNIGKNKETPPEQSAKDYADAARPFAGLVDYVVINVSSPNTPGLRALQTPEALQPIVGAVQQVIGAWKTVPPLLLKLAPELSGEDLKRILQAGESWGIRGWVLTNTLVGEWRVRASAGGLPALSGGLSGSPLTRIARERLIEARASTRLPIISVGGILSPEEAAARIAAGADLVQLYTGWVFGGPGFARAIRSKTG